jgi:hypothetical protein
MTAHGATTNSHCQDPALIERPLSRNNDDNPVCAFSARVTHTAGKWISHTRSSSAN